MLPRAKLTFSSIKCSQKPSYTINELVAIFSDTQVLDDCLGKSKKSDKPGMACAKGNKLGTAYALRSHLSDLQWSRI
ncbi:hypothetical protein [Scytonema sp. NUACC26]|uniref:hypothetical protein n=1 Tax=Scytonema sp. NUACC26 TaxID=3140176 RepID=UPI0038B40D2C